MNVTLFGGAGFLGTNLALALVKRGDGVLVVDNLSRPGSEKNAHLLANEGCVIYEHDILSDWMPRMHGVEVVVNLAGQTTVTESVKNPLEDARQNITGHLNVLEWCRSEAIHTIPPAVMFTSTNKVYGRLTDARTIDEEHPLDFKSPYGCSKGAADQYTLDYAATYGLRTIVFRQSCIYGDYQWGMEGQGWISWFAQRILRGEELTLYGNGAQTRDILHADDWTRVAVAAIDKHRSWNGQAYNIGGGEHNTITLLDAIEALEVLAGKPAKLLYAETRTADQPYYVSSIEKASREFKWEPKIGVIEGLERLVEWTRS